MGLILIRISVVSFIQTCHAFFYVVFLLYFWEKWYICIDGAFMVVRCMKEKGNRCESYTVPLL